MRQWVGRNQRKWMCIIILGNKSHKLSEKDKVDMAKTENLDVTHEKRNSWRIVWNRCCRAFKVPEVSPERDPITDNEEIFTTVEQMPEFPVVMQHYGYLAKFNLPNIAQWKRHPGKSNKFSIVEKDGSISNIQIVQVLAVDVRKKC